MHGDGFRSSKEYARVRLRTETLPERPQLYETPLCAEERNTEGGALECIRMLPPPAVKRLVSCRPTRASVFPSAMPEIRGGPSKMGRPQPPMLKELVTELAEWEAQLGSLGAQNMFIESSNSMSSISVPLFFDRDERTQVAL